MSPIKRSRRLQAGLAGLSVVSALGAAVGLGLTTSTHSSQADGSNATTGGSGSARETSHRSGESDDDGGRRQVSQPTRQHSSPVTPPTNTAPQATTSGS
jgi:hypothetical protein